MGQVLWLGAVVYKPSSRTDLFLASFPNLGALTDEGFSEGAWSVLRERDFAPCGAPSREEAGDFWADFGRFFSRLVVPCVVFIIVSVVS